MNAQLDLPTNDLVTSSISDEDLEKEFLNMERDRAKQESGTSSTEVDPRDIHICRWAGCMIQYQEMDELINHVNENHTPSKKDTTAEFVCRWSGCSRNGSNQPSRFALISHLRTHTGEKPLYCIIPECLRSFTRTDALLKHLKAVHNIDVSSLPEAYALINKNLLRSLQKFEKQNEYKIDIKDNGKKIASSVERRLHNERSMSHDELISSYMNMRQSSQSNLHNKILDNYKVKKIEFSRPRIEKITNQISNALKSYCDKVNNLEKEDKIAVVNNLDNIDDLRVEDLEKVLETQKDYHNKLIKLRRLLDEELIKYNNQNRYYWLKKQALLSHMLVNEESSID